MQYEALVEQLFFQLTPAVTFVRTSGYIASALQVRIEAYDAKRIGFNPCLLSREEIRSLYAFIMVASIKVGRGGLEVGNTIL